MKRFTNCLIALAISSLASAQVMDDFETNKLGWNEFSSKTAQATITKGVMHLESKGDRDAITYAYAPIDVTNNFEINIDALVKKVDDESCFGLIIDYLDDYNYTAFIVSEGNAKFMKVKEDKIVGQISSDIKLKEQKKASVKLTVKSSYQKVEFFVNGMKALERRFLPMESNGIGLFVAGKQKIDFDNLEIKQ